jgi:periplasmic protein CpxP/Spy
MTARFPAELFVFDLRRWCVPLHKTVSEKAAESEILSTMYNAFSLTVATLVLSGALLSGTANAQEKKPATGQPGQGEGKPRQRRQNPMMKMLTDLNLTAEQKTKIQAVVKKGGEERKALRENNSLTPDQKKAKNKELEKKTRTAVEGILTAEQKTKFTAAMEKMKKERNAAAKARGEKLGSPGSPKNPGS